MISIYSATLNILINYEMYIRVLCVPKSVYAYLLCVTLRCSLRYKYFTDQSVTFIIQIIVDCAGTNNT